MKPFFFTHFSLNLDFLNGYKDLAEMIPSGPLKNVRTINLCLFCSP